MTKKSFILAANQIKSTRGLNHSTVNTVYCDNLAYEFCNFFEKVNPRFDRAKFIKTTY